MDGIGLRRIGQQADPEIQRCVRNRRNGIGAGTVRLQPAFLAPLQLLAGQPSRALREATFDLPAIDVRVELVTDIVENIDAAQVVHAG